MSISTLISQIRAIDPDAAAYIETDTCRNLPSYNEDKPVCMTGIFNWNNTPQGHDYWATIDDQLPEVDEVE